MKNYLKTGVALLFVIMLASCSENEKQAKQQRPNILLSLS